MTLLLLILALAGCVESGHAPREQGEEIAGLEFVRKDIHVVMHCLELRFCLCITVEGGLTEEITWMPSRMTQDDLWATLRAVNGLEVHIQGRFVCIRRAAAASAPDEYRRQRAAFETHQLLPVMPRPVGSASNF